MSTDLLIGHAEQFRVDDEIDPSIDTGDHPATVVGAAEVGRISATLHARGRRAA